MRGLAPFLQSALLDRLTSDKALADPFVSENGNLYLLYDQIVLSRPIGSGSLVIKLFYKGSMTYCFDEYEAPQAGEMITLAGLAGRISMNVTAG